MSRLATTSDPPPQANTSTHHRNNAADVFQSSTSTESRRLVAEIKAGGQLQGPPLDSRTDAATARSLYYRLQFTEQQLARVMAEVATLRAGRAGTEEGPAQPGVQDAVSSGMSASSSALGSA
jgi:hypothetical protein